MNYTTYSHLSFTERAVIEHYNNLEFSIREIARKIKRSASTVLRELKRNTTSNGYVAEKAHTKYLKSFFKKQNKSENKYPEFTKHFLNYFDKKYHGVESTWERIKTEFPDMNIPSLKQVFNWINSNKWVIKRKDRLRRKYYKGGKRSTGYFSKFNTKYIIPIWARPNKINDRNEFGHWEIDLVIGTKGKNGRNLLTLTERKTRFNVIYPIKSKNPHILNAVLHKIIKQYELLVRSITSDNGLEFKALGLFGYQTGIDIYRCNPFASHERGTNENANGLIRRTYPKKTDFNKVKNTDIEILMDDINNMPRKIHNFKTAMTMFVQEMSLLNIPEEKTKLKQKAENKKKMRTPRRHGFNYMKKFNTSF